MTTQDFSYAIVALKRGGNIRRACWPEGVYLQLTDIHGYLKEPKDFIMRRSPGGSMPGALNSKDLLAGDWEGHTETEGEPE